MMAAELSANKKTFFNAALLATLVLATLIVVQYLSGAGVDPWLHFAFLPLGLIMLLVSGFASLRYPKGTPFRQSRKFLLFHGWFYMFMLFVFYSGIMVVIAREEAESRPLEETTIWEDPNKYHYLIFDKTIDSTSIGVAVNNSFCQSKVLDDRKSARFIVPLNGEAYEYGDTTTLEVSLRREGRVFTYSFDDFVLNQPPDSIFVALDGN